jgi:hypothetical protein
MAFFGTETETYYVSSLSGRIYLISSECSECRELPDGAEEVTMTGAIAHDVPREVFTNDEMSSSQLWELYCGQNPSEFMSGLDDLGDAVHAYVSECEFFTHVSDAGREWIQKRLIEHAESELA